MHPLSRIVTLSLMLSIPTLAVAGAEEFPVAAPITAVTVFPDRAEVTRSLSLALPAGQHVVVVDGLPGNLLTDSLRVTGSAEGELAIGAFELLPHFASELLDDEERALTTELDGLRDRQRELDDNIGGARLQLNFLNALAQEVPLRSTQPPPEGGVIDPAVWRDTLALLGSGTTEAQRIIRQAEIERRTLQADIRRIQSRLAQIRTGRRHGYQARINLTGTQPTEARLSLGYQLGGASWRPLYDARLDSDSGSLELVQMGEVTQRTGEDWSNVALSLSTARPSIGAQAPELDSWFIDFAPPPAPAATAKIARDIVIGAEQEDAATRGAGEPGSARAPLGEIPASVVASDFAAVYRIAGTASLAADNRPQRFTITRRNFDAALSVRSVPKLAERAYLFAKLAYSGEEPLLAGPTSVFRDGAFIGNAALALTRPGEVIDMSFGVDDRVAVSYRLAKGERSREGLISKDRRIERRYLITVTNHHQRPISVTLVDQLPVPRDERIEVELLDDATPPSATDFEDRSGVLAWVRDYAPGESRTLRFGYAVSYPEEEKVPGF
jgi:uncharacterized protein (TIGR02231 family)